MNALRKRFSKLKVDLNKLKWKVEWEDITEGEYYEVIATTPGAILFVGEIVQVIKEMNNKSIKVVRWIPPDEWMQSDPATIHIAYTMYNTRNYLFRATYDPAR